MSCEEYRDLITACVDEELTEPQRRQLEAHLQGCERCRRQLDELRALREELNMIQFKEPTDAELERYWRSVYNRLERGIGWILLSVGAILVLSYGGFRLVEQIVRDPGVALALKAGVLALVFGIAILFVSLLRERLAVRKVDKYSKEIDR